MSAFASLPLRLVHDGQNGEISSGQAFLRGLRGKCPNCGRGHMFRRFLKVADHCEVCGEELFHQRADDFPAYVVMVIVGHVVVSLALSVEVAFAPPTWVQLALWLPLTLALGIGLVQPVKGAIIAMQWFLGMHGFEHAHARRHGLVTAEENSFPETTDL